MNRCDICLEETCKGLHNCNCDTCDKVKECYRKLHATIRITTKCTQKCSHCCFECSPQEDKVMSIQTANEISQFLRSNDIDDINVMGGEFFLNKDWYEVIKSLGESVTTLRLVTTGDWVKDKKECEKLVKLNKELDSRLWLSISRDKWHNNINVEYACKFLDEHKIIYNVEKEEEGTDGSLVPIGRAEYNFSFYSMFSCYCRNPKHMYSFLINEKGVIYKCGFGVWDYAKVQDYLEGGFAERFKEFNKIVYSTFLSSCKSCINGARLSGHLELMHRKRKDA